MRSSWTGVLVASLVVLSGCKPKPIAAVPSRSKAQGPDTSDRETPGGKTLAASLSLLDPRSGDPETLDRQRHEFESKLQTLVPSPEGREAIGLPSLLKWHDLYTRRRETLARTLSDFRRLARDITPEAGFETRIDSSGQARRCSVAEAAQPTECKRVPGIEQLTGDFDAIQSAADDVLEAQWFVVTTLDAIRGRLDPGPY